MEGRTNILIAGLRLYPLPDNPTLEYDDEQGLRRVMLLSDDLDEIAALQRAWHQPDAPDIFALRWMDRHVRGKPQPSPPLTNPSLTPTYVLGWDFGAQKVSVIRERKAA